MYYVIYLGEVVRTIQAKNRREAMKKFGKNYGLYALVHEKRLKAYLK